MITITSNIDEVVLRFESLAQKAKDADFTEALVGGVNAAMARMKFRIFNERKDALAASLGKYTGKKKKVSLGKKARKNATAVGAKGSTFSPYELKRISHGRQVAEKDLEFYGTLRKAIQVVKEQKNKVVCAITSQEEGFIARSLEEQIAAIRSGTKPTLGGPKVPIFQLSAEELAFFKANTQALIKQIYDRLLQP